MPCNPEAILPASPSTCLLPHPPARPPSVPDALWCLLRQLCCWCAVLLTVGEGPHALKPEVTHKLNQLPVGGVTLTREACVVGEGVCEGVLLFWGGEGAGM